MSRILNHPRRAHVDELLADSLVLAKEGMMPIERKDPESLDFEDPSVWVIDAGLRHEPDKHNFGHHQLEHKENLSAFRLISKYYNLDDLFMEYYEWYLNYAVLDCQGLDVVAKINHTTSDVLHRFNSPFSSFLLTLFEINPNRITPLLQEIGQLMLVEIEQYKQRRKLVKDAAELLVLLKSVSGILFPVNIEEPEIGISQYKRKYLPFVTFSVVRDWPNQGWTIFRFDDFEGLDLSKLKGNPLVIYVNEKGFLAKTKDLLSRAALVSLLNLALT